MEFRRDLGISQQSVRRGVVKGTFLGIVSTFLMKCFVLLLPRWLSWIIDLSVSIILPGTVIVPIPVG